MTTQPATTPRRRMLAVGALGLGVASALAGCSTDAGGGDGAAADTSAEYADGTYTATGSYVAPSGTETIDVELTLEGDTVTAVEVTPHGSPGNAAQFQAQFAGGIAAEVVGKDIDTLNVSRVAGSSLTSGGFTDAVAQIKAEALVG